MLKKVQDYIAREHLLAPRALHLVALSGGADSVALLLALQQLGYRVEAAHCNFHLRGQESLRDEQFCLQLCQLRGIALHRTHFDTQTYASTHGVSIEMAARHLRYRYFAQLTDDIGAADVCVAHHQDDNVETILLNLLRGTGIQGLTGMRPRRDRIVRPLLCVSRREIEQWLHAQGQDYVTDSTNLLPDVQRNKIRLDVVPHLVQTNAHATAGILHTAAMLRQTQAAADSYLDEALRRLVDHDSIGRTALAAEPAPELILFRWLTPYGFSPTQIRQMAERLSTACTGRCWASDTHEVCTHRDRLLLSTLPAPFKPLVLPEAGTYVAGDGSRISLTLTDRVAIDSSPWVACLDADKAALPLTLRRTAPGDRIIPLGMQGSRLVSDLLTDVKMPVTDKRRQLVLTDSAGHVLWLPGIRTAQQCRITPETHRMMRLTFTPT